MGNRNLELDEQMSARANILARTNEMNGRYKLGNFGLDVLDDDFSMQSPKQIIERADLADKLISKAQAEGRDVDDPAVLRELASEVNKTVGRSAITVQFNALRSWWRRMVKYVTNPDED